MKKTNYGNESITSLKGAERVRKRPSVIFGSDDVAGCWQSVFEILSNSIDEAREGFGNLIEIKRFKDKSVEIQDFGRGIPVDYNQNEEKYNWELVFCELYAGGKYKNHEAGNYGYSLGLNGLGLCSTQYASQYMDVTIVRDGYEYSLHFEKGENIGGLVRERTTKKQTGSTIKWRPDLEVFTDIDIPLDYYLDVLNKQAVVNPNLKLRLFDEESSQTYEFLYEKGICDYILTVVKDSAFTPAKYISDSGMGRDREDKPDYKFKYEMVFCFSNVESRIEYYHNSSFLEHGGSPDKAVRQAFLAAVDNYIKQGNLYKKDEKKIVFSDIEDSLVLIYSGFSTVTSYENQTKKAINNKFVQEFLSASLKKELEIYFIENKVEADKIVNQALINKRSRETAEKTRINIKKKLTGNIDINNRVEKFINCRTKDINRREIYIVEGDSALGACKLGRDAEFQAIIPVRGKILNCLKADYDKIFNSDIITDLIKVLGCGVEIRAKRNKELNSFDLNKLMWSKIIICTDADVDGFQIRTLILTMIYRLMPALIEHKKVFIAESPLYEITAGKKTVFAYSEKEKNDAIKKLGDKCHIQRSKGLGENEPEMMWQTTMNPETRKLIAVLPEDMENTRVMFDILLGDNLKGRKDYIEEYGHKYIDMSEIV